MAEDRGQFFGVGKNGTVSALVVDGHGGSSVAEFVRQQLPRKLLQELPAGAAQASPGGQQASDGPKEGDGGLKQVDCQKQGDSSKAVRQPTEAKPDWPAALARAFRATETELAEALVPAASLGIRQAAEVGACAVCAVVLPAEIVVANVGDCRAAVVRRAAAPGLFAWLWSKVRGEDGPSGPRLVAINSMQNADNPEEQRLLHRQHPDEAKVVQCLSGNKHCYVNGLLQPTRSFGDFHLKSQKLAHPGAPASAKSYPYISAEPAVLRMPRAKADLCLVVGSDGLTDALGDAEIAAVVAEVYDDPTVKDVAQTVANRLVSRALDKSCAVRGLSRDVVARLTPEQRRSVHDDITVLVVDLAS